jgi:hypothetical protein
MSRLRIYIRASGDSALHRSGFSWTAALMFPLWALTRRLYKTAAVACIVLFVLSQLIPPLFSLIRDPVVQLIAAIVYMLAYWLALGLVASRWHRHVLERAGYVVTADELSESKGPGR